MVAYEQVSLHRLILTLSEALDQVHPAVMDHQQRVAYIATSVARQMRVRGQELLGVFHAAALHDLGLIGVQNKLKITRLRELESVHWHAQAGFELLKDNPLFADAAEIIRFHHTRWDDGAGEQVHGLAVPLASHIIALADAVETSIDRSVPILEQAESIANKVASRRGQQFHPRCVDAFRDVAGAEAFWLDTVFQRVCSILLNQVAGPMLTLDEEVLGPIAEVYARIVDASSRWTMVHTAGVAATAVALAERLNFSPRERCMMKAAALFHDVGKVNTPASILDKPGRLTKEEMTTVKGHAYRTFRILDAIGGMPQITEWAGFHHERLDGNGYPFHHAGPDITLGSRIVAVADVFTAVAEDRPYRKGMTAAQSQAALETAVANGGLDGDVVAVLRRDYDGIDRLRQQGQADYGRKQQALLNVLAGAGRPA